MSQVGKYWVIRCWDRPFLVSSLEQFCLPCYKGYMHIKTFLLNLIKSELMTVDRYVETKAKIHWHTLWYRHTKNEDIWQGVSPLKIRRLNDNKHNTKAPTRKQYRQLTSHTQRIQSEPTKLYVTKTNLLLIHDRLMRLTPKVCHKR